MESASQIEGWWAVAAQMSRLDRTVRRRLLTPVERVTGLPEAILGPLESWLGHPARICRDWHADGGWMWFRRLSDDALAVLLSEWPALRLPRDVAREARARFLDEGPQAAGRFLDGALAVTAASLRPDLLAALARESHPRMVAEHGRRIRDLGGRATWCAVPAAVALEAPGGDQVILHRDAAVMVRVVGCTLVDRQALG